MQLKHRHIQLSLAIILFIAALILLIIILEPSSTGYVEEKIAIPESKAVKKISGGDVSIRKAIAQSLSDTCAEARRPSQPDVVQPYTEDEREELLQRLQNDINKTKRTLIASSDPEHKHVSALLEEDPILRIDLISQALEAHADAYLLWDAVRICADSLNETGCPISEWEKKMLDVDGQNSEAWIRAAANRYESGDLGSAYAAMQQAAVAAESEDYWTHRLAMLERGFLAGSDLSFENRIERAFSVSAMQLPDYGAYVDMCKAEAPESIDWAYACLRYGETAERLGKTLIGQAIGRAIQKIALEAIGDDEQLTALERRGATTREQMNLDAQLNARLSQTSRLGIVGSSPTLFFAYLANIQTYGEAHAMTTLNSAIRDWLAENQDAGCVQ
ncbi:MAG: hypothetical protein AAGI44_01040 [Pseudomonadota bacterium]